MSNKPQLIIPMSGIGKRFIDAGYIEPKPLIKVDNKPIIQHVIELFNSPSDVIFICNEKHLNETNMREILLDICPEGKIYSVSNENRRGPVDAVDQISDFIEDNREIIVSYCDYGTYWDYDGFLENARNNDSDGSIACYTGFHPHMLGSDNYAFVKIDDNLAIEVQEKKPFTDNKMSELASNGTYYFKNGGIVKKYFKELIDLGISLNGEFYVSLVYNRLINDNLKVTTYLIDNMLQWGTPYDLEIYNSWSKYFTNKMNKQVLVSNPLDTTLILPMAGNGSRFSQDGYGLPKPMLDIDGKNMVIQAVDCLPKCQSNVFICLDSHITNFSIDKKLKTYYPNTSVLSLNKTTNGQATTCAYAINEINLDLDKPILISACDNGVYYNTAEYQKLLDDETIDIIVWSFRNNQTSKINPNAYAWLDVDKDNNIKFVSCKNFIFDDPLKTHAIIGTMFFRKGKYFMDGYLRNVNEDKKTNGEFYVDDVINQNIKEGLNVKVFEVDNYICWGTPNDYKTYQYWEDYFNKKIDHPYKNKKKIN